MNCPHCKQSLKIVVYPGKKTPAKKRGSFQLASIPFVSKIIDEPFYRINYTQGTKIYRDELLITVSEFKRMAYAVSCNNWLFSRAALVDWGGFTKYRANEIARHLSKVGLRFVDKQNRTTLLHRLMCHLRDEV